MSFTRRIVLVLFSAMTAAATFAGVAYVGVMTTMRDVIAPAPEAVMRAPAAAASSQSAPIAVAVVLGQSGTVSSDVLAPYEVFASSPTFSVYTVAESIQPARILGGPALMPVHTFDDVESGVAPRPDVVVVPAVQDATGEREAAMRDWIVRQHGAGAHIFGVCSGSEILAAAGVLDGRRATSHWGGIAELENTNPEVEWIRGQRYVQDGSVTTTAGITSGIPGALKVVQDFAGPEEAELVGRAVGYPGWTLKGPAAIPEQAHTGEDLSVALALVLPWMKPTVGVGVTDGVGEIDLAAAFEVYSQSYAARPIAVAPTDRITTRHGVVLATTPISDNPDVDRVVVPGATQAAAVDPRLRDWADGEQISIEPLRGTTGATGFDAALEDLAAHASRASALTVAKLIDYPADHLDLSNAGRQWRLHALLVVTVAFATAAGLSPNAIRRHIRRRRHTASPASGPPPRNQPWPRQRTTHGAARGVAT